MKHRIAAGVLVVEKDRLLLVHNVKPAVYDFWVAPGGGVLGSEDLPSAAAREALEETGLIIEPTSLVYIEELISADTRQCKFWYLGKVVGGSLRTAWPEAGSEPIVEAAFLTPAQLRGKLVFPVVLTEDFWAHLAQGFTQPRYLGIREMVTG